MRVALFAAILLGLPAAAVAQQYPAARPEPRTTDPAKMLDQARRREAAARIELAFNAELKGDWKRAAAEAERALALGPGEPQHSTALYDLGLAQAHLGKLEAAASAFRAAVALDPGFIAARANLIAVELMRGEVAAAQAAAGELMQRAPRSARALYEGGAAALRAGDAPGAIAAFGALLESNPSYANAHYGLALAELRLGRLDGAERELRRALALAPDFARARFALGAALLRMGKRDEARIAFDQAARTSQDPSLRDLATSLRDTIEKTH